MTKKILLIWPVFPWRGGISHHTNRLINTLGEAGHDISVISFSKQYPKFIYPWKAQREPEGTPNPLNIIPKYTLNPINPVTWWSTLRAMRSISPEVIIFKYWHPFFVPCFTLLAWFLKRMHRRIVVIIENLLPHERHFGDTWLLRLFFSQTDAVVTQSAIVHNQCTELFPEMLKIMIPHPVYDQFWPKVPQSDAQRKLQLPDNKIILLFFGFIRPYKGLDILLEALPSLIEQNSNIHLVIAWECFGSFEEYQNTIDKYNLLSHITLHLRYIPNSEIPLYFWASDLLVMPYRAMTNSGIENIGHIYANKTLLTLGVTSAELVEAILEKLQSNEKVEKNGTSWEEYGERLMDFLFSNNLWKY